MLNARSSPAVAGSYLAGATSGAAVSVAVLVILAGLVSPIPQTVRAAILLVLVATLAVRAAGLTQFSLPQNGRQIPQEAFRTRPTRAAFRFAFELGTSARTYITSEAPYAAALLVALLLPATAGPALTHALAMAAGFGLGRAWIVGTQLFRSAMIVEHPRWALQTANGLALAGAAWIAIRTLTVVTP